MLIPIALFFCFQISLTTVWSRAKHAKVMQSIKVNNDDRDVVDIANF